MKNVVLDLPTFGIIVATRVALGFGIGLLMADKLTNTRRRSIGVMLAIVGADDARTRSESNPLGRRSR
jgi:hypothetical protein